MDHPEGNLATIQRRVIIFFFFSSSPGGFCGSWWLLAASAAPGGSWLLELLAPMAHLSSIDQSISEACSPGACCALDTP